MEPVSEEGFSFCTPSLRPILLRPEATGVAVLCSFQLYEEEVTVGWLALEPVWQAKQPTTRPRKELVALYLMTPLLVPEVLLRVTCTTPPPVLPDASKADFAVSSGRFRDLQGVLLFRRVFGKVGTTKPPRGVKQLKGDKMYAKGQQSQCLSPPLRKAQQERPGPNQINPMLSRLAFGFLRSKVCDGTE